MGTIYSVFYGTTSESSDTESDMENEFSESSSEDQYVSDAKGVKPSSSKTISTADLKLVKECEDDLEEYEKISLLFLLSEDSLFALETIENLLNGVCKYPISNWAKNQKDFIWKDKFKEALAIIQNYKLLKRLGVDKKEAILRYLPQNTTCSLYIKRYKKLLYNIVDNLTANESQNLLRSVQREFEEYQVKFKEFQGNYLEMYLLYWIAVDYITPEDINNVEKHLKDTMINDSRKTEQEQGNQSYLKDRADDLNKLKYNIDPENPGLCLIINEEYFYSDPEVNTSGEFERRFGTDVDKKSLEETFKRYGFTVVIKDNRTDEQIREDLKEVMDNLGNYSSFFLAILSHGSEGKIYASNSVSIEVSELLNIMCTRNLEKLEGKPKVLIVQACQGSVCQQVTVKKPEVKSVLFPDELRGDGLQFTIPHTADVLIFWATVRGYKAIRDVRRGTWFIQTLCEAINNYGHEKHFDELCTIVKNKVISKLWVAGENEINVMVPMNETTLSKFLYLPPPRH